ncbi:hypothetical protein RC98_19060 [Pectobacterium carotovorum subsp. carotovorum]|uniref:DUF596 domain-containing protein n=1 Tax=Pectobacterium carotovorum TaxID=554 RepID=UPI00057FB256|nr:DUF596 domain-containing protein [Pectobacterium carotovorum]KHT24919.1 hypothetical protein RC98_19060 [Pectobacterium carotovorum subsp. carotovorum]
MDDNDIYDAVATSAYGLSMGAIWQHIAVECRSNPRTYPQRQVLFFTLLERLIAEGRIKLASQGDTLPGDPKHQVDRLRNAFPPEISDDEFDDVDEFGLWFLAKSPAGVVWITPEGQEIWT